MLLRLFLQIGTQTLKNHLMRIYIYIYYYFFPGSESDKSRTIIFIIVPIAAFVVLVISCVYFRVKRRPRSMHLLRYAIGTVLGVRFRCYYE